MKVVYSSTWTRRIGAACETAHISFPVWQPSAVGTTWIVRLETERQKVFSAPLPFWPVAVTPPLMVTAPGSWPRPATSV